MEAFDDFNKVRFIPALAGNIAFPRVSYAHKPVHPRARGEHAKRESQISRPGGSSPRSRGTSTALTELPQRRRFIPALAGNICFALASMMPLAVHPRARGEHVVHMCVVLALCGSSPRSRGTCVPRCRFCFRCRFIPALAGNISPPLLDFGAQTVHPRARGEHLYINVYSSFKCGSSPRSRGTYISEASIKSRKRFIPALAGNIVLGSSAVVVYTVHPRARGEHYLRAGIVERKLGSSPRSRGTLSENVVLPESARFIPALAGNIHGRYMYLRCKAVHPRARGEHTMSFAC